MTRVLFIAYWFPPLNVIGSTRPAKFVKYLPEHGIEPIVFSTRLDTFQGSDILDTGMDIPEIPIHRGRTLDVSQAMKSLLSRLGKGAPAPATGSAGGGDSPLSRVYHNLFSLPDPQLGWYLLSRRHALDICRKEKIDVIFSTAPPFSAHLTAAYVAKKTGIPWIADYRDLWSNNNMVYNKSGPFARFDRTMEKRAVARSVGITAAVSTIQDNLESLHKKPVRVITNGFDGDDYDFDANPPEVFTITYTGILYPEYRDPTLLFEALGELIKDGDLVPSGIRVQFFGRRMESLGESIRRFGLEDVVSVCGQVSSREVRRIQKSSSVLLMIDWMGDDPTAQGIGAKFYEYLAAKRPILCLGRHQSALARLIHDTGSGYFTTSVAETKEAILKLSWEHAAYRPNEDAVDRFSYDAITGELAAFLSELVS
jgi:hypothetical protein